MKLDLIFMGTPDFSVPTLAALIGAGHRIKCVYSQPPRPAGRGYRDRPSPVHAFAAAQGLAVRTPLNFKVEAERAAFAALEADAAVVVAYGLILPPAVLEAPRLGCLNLHASLLPRWRGAAPIQRAILAGDTETGVSVMQMDAGLDTGPVLLQRAVPIGPETNAQSLHDELARIGAPLMVEALAGLAAGEIQPKPQPTEGVTYAAKISKQEAHLRWDAPAAELDRMVRALNPFPGTWFDYDGDRIKVLAATPVAGSGAPGTVLDDALTVACGEGALRLTQLQRAGKAPQPADAFLRGYRLPAGARLL